MKDITIIGGGPGGYVAAIRAAQLGMKVCLIEKNKLGGTCLNKGCIPTKVLLKSASLYEQIKKASEFGIEAKEVEINIEKVIERKDRIVSQLVNGIEYLMHKNQIEVVKGEGCIKDRNTVVVKTTGQEIETQNIIIATGSLNVVPNIPGITSKNVLFSEDALNLRTKPSSIVIIGGGVIGIEFAAYFSAMGTKVTIIEAMNNILPNMDIEISTIIREIMQKKNIEIHNGSYVREIKDNGVIFENNGERVFIESEAVLCAIGRVPYGIDILNNNIVLNFNKKAINTNEKMETNIQNIYCIGDANGKSMLAHTAMKEGITAVDNIAGENKKMEYDNIPSIVFASPEIASVGLTEEQCKEGGINYKVGRFSYNMNGKALSEGEEGLIKVITDTEYGEILGVHIIGNHAADLIMEGCIAKTNELTTDEIIRTVHPHPTVSEAFEEAVLNTLNIGLHS